MPRAIEILGLDGAFSNLERVCAKQGMDWKVNLRKRARERRMFDAAFASGTVEDFQAYLARGGPRTSVSQVYLPRAELRQAMAEMRAGTFIKTGSESVRR